MIDKYKELKENIKFIAQCCNNEYNDVRVDEVLLGSLEVINRQQAEQETLQKALAEKDRTIKCLTAEKEQLIKAFGECQAEATRVILKNEKEVQRLKDNVSAMAIAMQIPPKRNDR